MNEIRARIERLCAILGDDESYLRDTADLAGAGEALASALSIVRGNCPEAGDEQLAHDLDSLDEAMARAGYGYLTHPERVFRTLPGHPLPATVDAWSCPAPRACSRLALVRDGQAQACPITGKAMKRVRFEP